MKPTILTLDTQEKLFDPDLNPSAFVDLVANQVLQCHSPALCVAVIHLDRLAVTHAWYINVMFY